MAIQITTSTAASPAFATRPVTLHSVVWSNTSTTDRTVTFRDAKTATATTSVFEVHALRRDHGAFSFGGGGKRFNSGLSADKTGTRVTVAYDDYS